ncbi:hypothetical protein H257_19325 [Aphanomyces astaci]|uniref:Integrase zinc-binding domain-containing protein n=1 Tax=Aphanomyces astaci TaxID=112090 RepID=W4F8E2_APHAT|nr:hypothetical protein H257_19325 [Aphanomyces astaci]ETV63745.1 hypothetical protein H257_19325 [Aphanomyces astaci]|eukprot:XP_009846772.1 hypothetical protein H257_19325 [Aphanomyces astaci]
MGLDDECKPSPSSKQVEAPQGGKPQVPRREGGREHAVKNNGTVGRKAESIVPKGAKMGCLTCDGSDVDLPLIHVVSPLQQMDFKWPTAATISDIQRPTMETDDAVDLHQRICVIAHQGASSHRRIAATIKSVFDMFVWKTLSTDVEAFVRACLHCLCIDGDMVPRPLGSSLHAKTNVLIYFEWLSIPMANSGQKQVRLVNDDMRGFVQLFAAASVMPPRTLNDHHLTTAYSPWADVTVEVDNRLMLRALKALLSEMKLNEWPHVQPLLQGALYHQPAVRLGEIVPVTAFTDLPAITPWQALTIRRRRNFTSRTGLALPVRNMSLTSKRCNW